ncbi:DNA-binding protein [Desulfobulbus oligotrophicus]|uniref:DNA-binding protein n=1 Tax=Desulfobulbus oligotrophicus TaxID=1909699 RepID=A0A7T5VCR1_9BACT|nr:DNA-binding protein [Desulfobulbus oligotrophicus]QQG65485.1 DNA-binding protein [Desulfobulbus oligotrophicus]
MTNIRTTLLHAALVFLLAFPSLVLAKETKTAGPDPETAQVKSGETVLLGTVLETMNSNGYTYVYLDTKEGKTWVAVPETSVTTGESIACMPGIPMHNFTSNTLNRTFETIIFSPGLDKKHGNAQNVASDTSKTGKQENSFESALRTEMSSTKEHAGAIDTMGQSTGSAGAIVPSADLSIDKAVGPDSYSVAECFQQGKDLDGKTVHVRGKIMKISRMIMGKNWLHLQDGTGDAKKNHHDLVVTTTADVEEGKVVTIAGTLAFNRDFGAGYKYEVIVEDAKIEQ